MKSVQHPQRRRGQADREHDVEKIAPGQLDDCERVLLSIAERAGAAELQPGGGGVTGARELMCRAARVRPHLAIKAARDRGWSHTRRSSASSPTHRVPPRSILEHFGRRHRGPDRRCCSVCHPDEALTGPPPRRLPRQDAGAGASSRAGWEA